MVKINLDAFVAEIQEKIKYEALLTITPGKDDTPFDKWEIIYENNKYLFDGYPQNVKLFKQTLERILQTSQMLAIIMRLATRQKYTNGNLIMEVWGYRLVFEEQNLDIVPIPHFELYDAFTHHHETGEAILPEEEVIYCGPEGKICGWDMV